MIIHDNQQIKNQSSELFKALRKTLNEEDFVRDFIKDNLSNNNATNDPNLLDKKMTFLEALIAEPYLQVSPILTSITLNPKENDPAQFFNRAKLLRLVRISFIIYLYSLETNSFQTQQRCLL
jgi:hypothetical protein